MNDTSVIAFTGDIGFDHYMDRRWEDEDLLSEEVVAYLTSADHVVVNPEGAVMDDRSRLVHCAEERLLHTIDPAALRVLDEVGADIWNLANNHMMDAGAAGLEMTLEEAKRHGAMTIGAGMNIEEAMRPVILPEAGGIGIFAVGYRRGCKPAAEDAAGCFMWNDMDAIRDVVALVKKTCRWCVIVCHGGEEFTSLPTPYTRDRYLAYLDMGADVVVCHHPHVPMNYELAGDKAIFYSLGNFIFDTDYQRAQYNTEKGILLKLCFTEEEFTFDAMGVRIDRENERVVAGETADIFTDVPAAEYEMLVPLAAKMFVSATKRQQVFMYPEKFEGATEDVWREHFADPRRSGRVEGEALDFLVVCPLAERAKDREWEKSRLTAVKRYILEQI